MTDARPPLFDIIFRGDLRPGQSLPQVKLRMAQLFKTDATHVDALFRGGAVPLKRNLERATAEKYQAVLHKVGVEVQIAEAGTVGVKAPRPLQAKSRAGSNAAAERPPQTLQERLAAQEADAKRQQLEREKAEQQDPAVSPGWSLAPAGADLLQASERSQVMALEPDVSRYSLRPQEGELLDASEKPAPVVAAVEVSDYGLSEPGEALLRAEERVPEATVSIQVPDVDLAPAGSDLGQLRSDRKPLTPDISHLTVEPLPSPANPSG